VSTPRLVLATLAVVTGAARDEAEEFEHTWCLVLRQIFIWAPVALLYTPSWAPGQDYRHANQLDQALPLWATAWLFLVVITAAELGIQRWYFRHLIDRVDAAIVAGGLAAACALAAVPLWWMAGAVFEP
jgi:hypothetical protein